jgi:hypothetical protein
MFAADADLERALRDLSAHVEFPPTPDLALAVRRRLAVAPAPRSPRRWFAFEPGWQRALAVAVVAFLVLVGAALAISPAARQAVAERIGLRGVTIEYVPEAPTPGPTSTPGPTPPPPGAALGLGTPTTLAEARAAAVFPLLVSADLGEPDAVYLRDANQVSLAYRPREGVLPPTSATGVGLLLTQFRATLDASLFGKGVPPGARLEEVQVNGTRGYFISGAPHVFFYRDSRNQVQDERSRLAGNTLLWQANGVTYRIESALDRDSAIRIAESLR